MEAELYDNTQASITLTLQAEIFLRNTAKWGKFMAIVGFAITGLMVLGGLLSGVILSGFSDKNETLTGFSSGFITTFSFISVLYFIPLFYLYRFSSRMSEALNLRNGDLATESLGNLKSLFKFMGIMTIIGIGFYFLMIAFSAFWLNGFRM